MKKVSPFELLLVGIFLFSCSKEKLSVPEAVPGDFEPAITLTADEAERLPLFERQMSRSHTEVLAIADGLMAQVAEDERRTQTKSAARGAAALTDSMVIAMPQTKSAGSQLPAEAKIYTVHFGEDAGYTLVAGDKRVRTAVLAYDGAGSFELDTDNPGAQLAMELMQAYVQTEIERVEAMRGDSIYTALQAKYGFGAELQAGEGGSSSKAFQYPPEYFPIDGLPGSSPDNPYGRQEGYNWQVVTNGIIWYWAPVDNLVATGTSGGQQLINITYPLCRSRWGQNWPYNVEVAVTESPGSPAGCVATAMAQIMRFHKRPANYRWEEYGVNTASRLYDLEHYQWTWESKSSAVINEVGALFHRIGNDVGMEYTPTVASISISQEIEAVPKAFKSFGYYSPPSLSVMNVAEMCSYLEYDKKPIYARGNPTGPGGHAWVVDGLSRYADYTDRYHDAYYQGQRVGYIKVRTINYYVHNTSEQYFHCNWGWDGRADGWFLAGTFNNQYYNYTRSLRMLLYIN